MQKLLKPKQNLLNRERSRDQCHEKYCLQVLLVTTTAVTATADPDADPYYAVYGYNPGYTAALGYPYFAAGTGYALPPSYGSNSYGYIPRTVNTRGYGYNTLHSSPHPGSGYIPQHTVSGYNPHIVSTEAYHPQHSVALHANNVVRPEAAPHSVAAVPEVGHHDLHHHDPHHHDLQHVTATQYHAQDEEGNYSFGYRNPNSARTESGNPYTGVTG